MRSVFLLTFRQRRRATIGWCLAFAGIPAMYLALFPTVRANPDLNRIIASYPAALKAAFGLRDITSAAGYLNTELFSLSVPLLFTIMAIGFASATTTQEERDGTMDVLASHPVTRRGILLGKFLAFGLSVVFCGACLFVVLAAGSFLIQMHLGLGRIGAAILGPLLLAGFLAALSLLAACLTGRRGIAIAVGAVVAVLSFVVGSLASTIHWLHGLQAFSPLYHAGGYGPLTADFSLGHLAALALPAAVMLAGAVGAFERRDLGS